MTEGTVRVQDFFDADGLQHKAKSIVLNVTLEHKWMLEAKEKIVTDLLQRLDRYPPGTYKVGIHAHHVNVGHIQRWSFDYVRLLQLHNIMTACPFYVGTVIKR